MRMTLPAAFLEMEADYRQRQVAEDFSRRRAAARARQRNRGRRRHWVPRRPHLQLPGRRRRPLAVA